MDRNSKWANYMRVEVKSLPAEIFKFCQKLCHLFQIIFFVSGLKKKQKNWLVFMANQKISVQKTVPIELFSLSSQCEHPTHLLLHQCHSCSAWGLHPVCPVICSCHHRQSHSYAVSHKHTSFWICAMGCLPPFQAPMSRSTLP